MKDKLLENINRSNMLINSLSPNITNKNVLDMIPIRGSEYRIGDIVTDFSSMDWTLDKINGFNRKCIISFSQIPEYAVFPIKIYTTFKIYKGLKASTIKDYISIIISLFKQLQLLHPTLNDISKIKLDDLIKIETRNREGKVLADFFMIVQRTGISTLSFNPDDYENELDRRYFNGHFDLIPSTLFKKILEVTKQVMEDVSCPLNDRIMACSIRILTQIAPRISEFLQFKTNQISYRNIPGKGMVCYLFYRVSKTEQGDLTRVVEVPMCYTAETAYKKLIELRKSCKCHSETDILFCYDDDKTLPVNDKTFRKRYISFFLKYLSNEIHKTYENFEGMRVNGEKLSIPKIHSYRVNVVTELYSNNVRLDYIRRRMSHLSQLSEITYTRNVIPTGVEPEHVDKILSHEKDMMQDENAAEDSERAKLIAEFLEKGNLKIFKADTGEILSLKGSKNFSPIRGGFCMKGIDAKIVSLNAPNSIKQTEIIDFNLVPSFLDGFREKRKLYTRQMQEGNYAEGKITEKELNILSINISEAIRRINKECRAIGEDNFLFDCPELDEVVRYSKNILKELEHWRYKS